MVTARGGRRAEGCSLNGTASVETTRGSLAQVFCNAGCVVWLRFTRHYCSDSAPAHDTTGKPTHVRAKARATVAQVTPRATNS